MKTLTKAIICLSILCQIPVSTWAACLPLELCARVTGLQDINFGNYSFTGDLQNDYSFCSYVQNDNESNYFVTVNGSGSGSAYVVTSGAEAITGTVEYAKEEVTPSYAVVSPTVSQLFQDPNTVSEDCSLGGDSATIRVTFDEADLQAATAGTYTGTIDITVSPD